MSHSSKVNSQSVLPPKLCEPISKMPRVAEVIVVLYSKYARLKQSLDLCRCRFQPELKLWGAHHLHLLSVPFMAHPRKDNLSPGPWRGRRSSGIRRHVAPELLSALGVMNIGLGPWRNPTAGYIGGWRQELLGERCGAIKSGSRPAGACASPGVAPLQGETSCQCHRGEKATLDQRVIKTQAFSSWALVAAQASLRET